MRLDASRDLYVLHASYILCFRVVTDLVRLAVWPYYCACRTPRPRSASCSSDTYAGSYRIAMPRYVHSLLPTLLPFFYLPGTKYIWAQLRTSTSERLVLSLDELLDVQLDLVERLGTQDDEQVERVEQARDACEELLLSTTWTSLPDAQEAAMQVQDHLGRMLTIGSDAQTH